MADRKHVLHVKSNVAETTTQYGIDDFLVTPKKPVDSSTGKATDDTLLYGEIAVNYGKGVEALTIRNTEDNVVAFVNENDFHEANEIAADGLATEKLEREEADATEKMERVEADESLRDDLDEMRGVYGTNHRGPVVRDNNGNEVMELTDSGLVQIDYPDAGHEHPAIQINGDTVKVKDTEGVVRIEVNEVGVRLKGAPNDDTTEPEITLNKDNAGGVTIKGGSDTNFVLKPDRALLNSHSNGLGYKYDLDNIDDQTLQIDLGSEPVIKAVTRLENDGVVDREENVSVKTPNTVRGGHENIMQANGRRYILYHPGGTAQMLHSNPSGTDKDGNVTGKVFFLDSYHDGGNRLLEVTDEGDRTQGQNESHTVYLNRPGTGDTDGLRINSFYNHSSGTETHKLEMLVGGNTTLWAERQDGPSGSDTTTSVQVEGNDLVYGSYRRDGDENDIERSVLITAAGEHDVLRGAFTSDPNTGDIVRETNVMTDGNSILTGRENLPTSGNNVYTTTLQNPEGSEVLRAEKRDGNNQTVSVSMENNGEGQLLAAYYDLDNGNKHISIMNNGDDVIRAEVRTQDIGGTLQEQKEFSIGFLASEITILKDLNNQTISLADYIGERIPSDYVDKETFDTKEEVISTALNELHDSIPNMDNYYTKTEIDNKFSEIETLLSQI